MRQPAAPRPFCRKSSATRFLFAAKTAAKYPADQDFNPKVDGLDVNLGPRPLCRKEAATKLLFAARTGGRNPADKYFAAGLTDLHHYTLRMPRGSHVEDNDGRDLATLNPET